MLSFCKFPRLNPNCGHLWILMLRIVGSIFLLISEGNNLSLKNLSRIKILVQEFSISIDKEKRF